MKTTGDANITLLQGHEAMAKIIFLGFAGDGYAQLLVCGMLSTIIRSR